ncbi:MAG: histone acetyltransferase 1 [Piccolia ochrophora]|nr:MAG: histone acetyltransferase 1 [Piccolia ochrophora]
MEEAQDWSSDAKQAVTLSLVQPGQHQPHPIATFHPKFAYPIFGEAESIFGYEGLDIDLRFASHDLRPSLDVSWKRKYQSTGETSATDVKAILQEWLPAAAFEPRSEFNAIVQSNEAPEHANPKNFTPPGQRLTTYTIRDKTYEIWQGSLTDDAVQEIFQRLQIFTPLFIEGGTYIDLNDPEWSLQRWRVFFLYEKLATPPTSFASPYSIVGYSTVYRYYLYTPPTPPTSPLPANASSAISKPSTVHSFSLPLSPVPPSSLPSRERISQFLILHPYQKGGHGRAFYNALVTHFLTDATVHEITVEDPNEAFDDLRDICDLIRLRTNPTFTSVCINSAASVPRKGRFPTGDILPKKNLTALRKATKIAPRQFDRLVEMQLLSLFPSTIRTASRSARRTGTVGSKEREYYLWRMVVKQRLYKFNRDQLVQLERLERLDKLEEALGAVEHSYLTLLTAADKAAQAQESHAASGAARKDARKKLVIEDEDDDEEVSEEPAAKRMKTSES